MSKEELLNICLAILRSIKDDKKSLEKLLDFMQNEFIDNTSIDLSNIPDFKKEIPEKYRETVKQIADNMTARIITFVNPATLEVDEIYDGLYREKYKEDDSSSFSKWDKCVVSQPLGSKDSFEFMEEFINLLPDDNENQNYYRQLQAGNLLQNSIILYTNQSIKNLGLNLEQNSVKNM